MKKYKYQNPPIFVNGDADCPWCGRPIVYGELLECEKCGKYGCWACEFLFADEIKDKILCDECH
jgi:hypothetical protein